MTDKNKTLAPGSYYLGSLWKCYTREGIYQEVAGVIDLMRVAVPTTLLSLENLMIRQRLWEYNRRNRCSRELHAVLFLVSADTHDKDLCKQAAESFNQSGGSIMDRLIWGQTRSYPDMPFTAKDCELVFPEESLQESITASLALYDGDPTGNKEG